MRRKLYATLARQARRGACLILIALGAGCAPPSALVTPPPVFNPTFTLSTPTPAFVPSAITLRERFTLRDLPGTGRNPVAIAALENKVYVVNSETNNVAIIQDQRAIK